MQNIWRSAGVAIRNEFASGKERVKVEMQNAGCLLMALRLTAFG